MSLQVWLPLNGNLNNQGLSNITITNNGATVDNAGKIGKCYYFNASSYLNETSYDWSTFNTSEFSLCCWYKQPSPVASGNSQIICIGTNSGWNNIRIGLLRRTSNGYPMFSVSDGTNAVQYGFTATSFSLDAWNHIAVTYNNGEMKMYINGVLDKTLTTTIIPTLNSSQHLGIGSASNGAEKLTGYLNDVRIYDHCLSPKEVEEISKGLILHYKLDDSYIESTTILSCDISETAYNGAINKYGYNDDSNLIKTTGNFQGKNCVKVTTRTSGASATPYVYFSNLFTSDGSNAPAYKTLSFDYYTTVPTTTWLNIYKLGSGSGTATWKTTNSEGIKTGTYTNSSNSISVKPNEWNHIEVTFHGTTEANAEWGYCINGPAHTSNPDTFYFLYANIQLEQKDHATGYGAAMHSNIIYDSSGYNNNGEIINDLQIISTSPRYLTATNLTTTSSHVHVSNLSVTGFSNSYTFTWWGNCSTYSGKMMWGFSDGVRLNGIYNGNLWNTGDGSNNPLYTPGTTTQISAPSVNVWHHFAMVGNGTQCLVYLDGILWGQAKTYKTISGTSIYFNGWLNNTDYTLANTKLSDFRIYSTALSAAQIKELYDTSVSVDSFGNIHAREVIE